MKLTIKQTLALDYLEDNVTTEIGFGGGAGGGKSALGNYWLMKSSYKYPETRYLMGRAVAKTLKETTLKTFFEIAAKQGLKSGSDFVYKENKSLIEFPRTGSEIILKDLFAYPSDPNFDELGSLEITGAFIDEFNQVTEKAFSIVKSRIRYKLDQYDLVPKILGTCNPSKNYVYKRFYLPYRDGTLPTDRKFVQSLLSDNKENISRHYEKNLEGLDEVSKQRLLYGNWEYDDDPAAMVQYDCIVNLFSNLFVASGAKYITADIARLGKDFTKIYVWEGFRVIKTYTLSKSRVDDTAKSIREIATKHGVPMSNVVCDEDGVGGGVVDILRCKGFIANSTPIQVPNSVHNYGNLKAQCGHALATVINENRMFVAAESVEHEKLITEDLGQLKRKDIDKDGKFYLIPKEVMKRNLGGRSTDDMDNMIMRMIFEVQPVKKAQGISSRII
jgi:hypothetical protein